ncbi:MAG: hypothetical protein K0V04_25800 [Deltaproteobacteria bacterium]|nr:hypothetical protein [Deltaproteobacteria bacterium]
MEPRNEPWSTPKLVAVAGLVTFSVMLLGNGILNEVLHLGVPNAALAAGSGAMMAPFVMRWRGLHRED